MGLNDRAGRTSIGRQAYHRVALAADLYFSGNTVIVDHGLGLYSYFGHLSKFIVKERMEVRRGDLLGYVGATGRVTGPHLHWAIRLVGTRVDPMSLLDAARE
jgi:murein DD-endopeptidase MepM/ murein hydrolase activator NlpD